MDSSLVITLSILFTLLCLSALFSSSETAITAMSRGRLMALKEKHPSFARILDWLMQDVQRALTVTLVANNLVNIAASAVATSVALIIFGDKGLFIAVLVMTFMIVIFGEILPKSLAIVRSESLLIFTLPFLRTISFIFSPLLFILTGLVRFLGSLLHVDLSSPHTFVTREEIEQMVNIGEASGVFEEVERRMIHGIISFKESRVYEIMVPRTDMDAVASDVTIGDAVGVFQEHGHSRVPIYDGSLDNIVGILYVKDTIPYLSTGQANEPVLKLKREPLFVPETMKIVDLFNTMKGKHIHMAIIVDEYGGTAGIVTLEDLLEEIVGEIQDEFDKENPPVKKENKDSFLVEGQVSLEDLSDILHYPFVSEEAESVGGLTLSLAGEFPEEGFKAVYGQWTIEVLELEDHRIKMLRLQRNISRKPEHDEDMPL